MTSNVIFMEQPPESANDYHWMVPGLFVINVMTHLWTLNPLLAVALVRLVDSQAWRHAPEEAILYNPPLEISGVAIRATFSTTQAFKVRSKFKGESWCVKWHSWQPFSLHLIIIKLNHVIQCYNRGVSHGMWHRNSCEILRSFQYCSCVVDCSVQYVVRTRNPETTPIGSCSCNR